MLYEITDGSVSLDGQEILSHFDFQIRGSEKIALTGKNGTGKSTLLRLIAGELHLDRDDKRKQPGIQSSRKVTIGYLRQQVFAGEEESEKTVEEELLEACPCKDTWDRERFFYEQEYDRMFTEFGFSKEDKQKRLCEFSGGQKTRIALIRLLLARPDILLLDEPTNHLDEEMTMWLENWLKSYEKAVVMVSHDRFFLDETAEVVYEITEKKLCRYVGNYTSFVEQKRKREAQLLKEWEQQQAEIERLNELIRKFHNKPRKAAFARSRQKLLERMEKLEKPGQNAVWKLPSAIEPAILSSKYVLEAEELQIGYEKMLLEITLRIRRGQKIGIIGPNGIGKSTFLKTAAGIIPPLKGKCLMGQRVEMEYFDQQTAAWQSEMSVIEHFQAQYPSLTNKEARGILGRFLFSGKDAAKMVSELSGGEKSRLKFAEIFQNRPNFLLLDEPTNHMDIQAREVLEANLRAYEGTVLFVSHDRYFIDRIAQALLVFEKDKVTYYPFGYRHYLERKQREARYPHAMKAEELGMRAEDKALVESMRNVPEAEKGMLKRISTEQLYQDWKLGLLEEDLSQCLERCEGLEQQIAQAEEALYVLWITSKNEDCGKLEEIEELEKQLQDLFEKLEKAQELYTKRCLEWDELTEPLDAELEDIRDDIPEE